MPEQGHTQDEECWPALPTETEIYILPDGEIVIADLPAELAEALTHFIKQQVEDSTTAQVSDDDEPNTINT